ncbi:MAG: DUF1957 domain-containing protein [Acidobacteria bacterium]|nr:DUF1957 domain-containing protein [Acidobacteriota bacterium]
MIRPRSALVLLLHAHLPWVRHAELPAFLEERWLFEAVLESYLPLIDTLRGLTADGIPLRITIDVSPTLVAMLSDPLLTRRTEQHALDLLQLVDRERQRAAGNGPLQQLVRFYRERLERLLALYREELRRDIPGELARLEAEGVLELATCGATHALLPLWLDRPEIVRGQVRSAVREHQRVFGRAPRGIWLPECAFAPALERHLAEAGLRWFFVETHALEHASPRPRDGVFAPVRGPRGVAAFARDPSAAQQVWSSRAGYPADPVYRDFHRDIGWELPAELLQPCADPSGERSFTGLKYHRVADRSGRHPELYDPVGGRERAADHAAHFLAARLAEARGFTGRTGRPAVIACPYDAELFGHWWFEGPWFLDQLFRGLAWDQDELAALTPADVLEAWPEREVVELETSTWGAGGYFETWLGPRVEWMLPPLVALGEDLLRLLRTRAGESPFVDRVLRQAAREAMLAQASDWPFLVTNGTAPDYAKRRFLGHVENFGALARMLDEGPHDETILADLEDRDRILPDLDLDWALS